jgi:outer membrane usher protein
MYRNFSSTQNTPVLQAYVRYGLNEFWSPGVEILLGSEYRNVGLQASFNSKLGSLTFNSLFSNLSSNNKSGSGFAQNVNYTSPAWGPLAVISGLGTQSFKYTTPSAGLNMGSTALFTNDAFKYNAFVGLSSNLASRGGLSLSVNQQRNWNDQGSQQVRLSYGVNIKTVFLGINLDRTTFTDTSPSVRTLSASASVPLDFLGSMKGQLRGSFIQTGSEDPSQTLSYYGNNSDSTVSYSLNETKTGDNSASGASVGWSHDYGNLGASVSSSSSPSSDSSTQYSLTASGGLVLHRGGVLATPSLGETFAILEVPNGKGVSVAGSTGRINSSGYGVVPYLSPYYVNDVQISLEGASTDLEVDIPTQKVAPVEGSISRLKFNTNSGRPLLIIFQTSTGVRVPIGATVTDSTGLEVGTVGQGSRALVRINKTQDQLSVTWGNAPDEKCLVDFVLDAKNQANSNGYTNLKLACLVGAAVDKTAQK